ncbi:conserved hypothetical protein [Candidatus Terasakiella magnetica]|uniref:SiaC family regulatory phosphoprotein domain-containing protein n=1 Tax=Candidatus Terasakiella magnetica TaxID=1867952 RepID=A0A1C3RC02_9PROT|nr:DUF1987 domain-containing protein [Candidatus Terasakiella magnetica]SCA54764.1 conserved hypothetical protein [Candidatus Terasakiella magnetica]
MENVKIAATERSPEIEFDFDSNVFTMRGESYPEDVNEFFGPLMERLESHFEDQDASEIKFTFELIYFNSSTAKILMGLFDLFDETAEAGNKVLVEWRFEEDDDNMEELGEEYGEDLEFAEFILKEVAAD